MSLINELIAAYPSNVALDPNNGGTGLSPAGLPAGLVLTTTGNSPLGFACQAVPTPVVATSANAINSLTTSVNFSNQAAPTAGQVATAISGTAAQWQTPAFITPQFAVFEEQQTSGTNGGTGSNGFNTRLLNTTVANTITGASLGSNQVTLPAGTYDIVGWAVDAQGSPSTTSQLCIYDATDSTFLALGASCTNGAGPLSEETITGVCNAVITLSVSKAIILNHYLSSGSTTNSFGRAANSGQFEVYSQIKIVKYA